MSQTPLLVFKYGGNAMTHQTLKNQVVTNICTLTKQGYRVIIAHGGGPAIEKALAQASIASTFIDGHRQTTTEAIRHVEMALKGEVNGALVSLVNHLGYRGVGLSGKDGSTVTSKKKEHVQIVDGKSIPVDLGRVADVASVDVRLIHLLLDNGYIPVITCLADDASGQTYNINGDVFAGHLAGALQATKYCVLTDVDGLLEDVTDPSSLIRQMNCRELASLRTSGKIKGGMLPKLASCQIALELGAAQACIINGTRPEQILQLFDSPIPGTLFTQ